MGDDPVVSAALGGTETHNTHQCQTKEIPAEGKCDQREHGPTTRRSKYISGPLPYMWPQPTMTSSGWSDNLAVRSTWPSCREDLSSVLNTHIRGFTTTWISSFQESGALLWPAQVLNVLNLHEQHSRRSLLQTSGPELSTISCELAYPSQLTL